MKARLLIGPAGSGKTTRCLAALRECERAGVAALLVVPDQFTYAADRLLLETPDLPGTRCVRIVSFRRLARLIAQSRHERMNLLSEEGRRLLLRRILLALPVDELGPLAPVRHMPGLLEALALTLREVKGIAGRASAEQLADAAVAREPGAIGAKVAAIGRIVRAYDEALASSGLIDPGDWIHDLAAGLRRDPGPWAGRRIWIDGFMSFTPEERALLPALAAIAGELTITLCADPHDARRLLAEADAASAHGIPPLSALFARGARERIRRPQFLPTLRTALWLQERLTGLAIETLEESPRRFAARAELTRLEATLFAPAPRGDAARARETPPAAPDRAVRLRPCSTPYHEVVTWARWIDARARGGGGRYREHAVMVRDLDAYRPLVHEVFARYAIPVYLDERRDAAAHPLVRLCLAAIQLAARGWVREVVMELLRNRLLRVPPETADRIENLSLEYGIDYERWLTTDWEVFRMPPRERGRGAGREGDAGGVADEDAPETATEETEEDPVGAGDDEPAIMEARRHAAAEARAVTQRLFPPLRRFTDAWRGRELPFTEARTALSELLASLPAAAGDAAADAAIEGWTADETARVSALLDQTLELGAQLVGDAPVGAGIFARLLREGLAEASIGVAPQALDAVTIADPRRSRVNEARHVVVGGLSASLFPQPAAEDPLFTDEERRQIAERGFPIGAHAALRSEEDPYLLYIACTRAAEDLLLTFPMLDASGKQQEPSPYLDEIALALGRDLRTIDPAADDPYAPGAAPLAHCRSACEVEPALARVFAGLDTAAAGRVAQAARTTLSAVPGSDAACSRARRYVDYLRAPLPTRLPADLIERIYPDRTLSTSASRLEIFGTCPFRHFAHYALRLTPRPEAVLTPLSTGSAVHAALERFFSRTRAGESPDEAALRLSAIFTALAQEDEFRIFQQDPPSAYRWSATAREIGLFIRAEQRRLSRSGFQPRAVELAFGLEAAGCQGTDAERIARARGQLSQDDCSAELMLPALTLVIPPEASATSDTPDAGDARTGGTIRLRGQIDRLDLAVSETGESNALVIDYKRSPRGRAPARELVRGLDLQIATYLLAVREILGFEPVAGFYYGVSPQPRREPVDAADPNPLGFQLQGFCVRSAADAIDPEQRLVKRRGASVRDQGLDDVLETVRSRIVSYGGRILAGEIRPAPVASSGQLPCAMCDYRGVCRFDATFMPAAEAPAAPGDES